MYLLKESMWSKQPQKRYLYPTCSLRTASQDCPQQREIKKLYLNHLKLKFTDLYIDNFIYFYYIYNRNMVSAGIFRQNGVQKYWYIIWKERS